MEVDAGNAGELRNVVLKALANNTTFPIIIDKPRVLRVIHTSHTATEFKLMTRDDESGEYIALSIPYDLPGQRLRARADISGNTMR